MGCGSSLRKQYPVECKGEYLPDYKGDGPFFVMEADACQKIRYSGKGPGSKEVNPALTIHGLLDLAVEKNGDKLAMRVERVKEEETKRWVPPPKEVTSLPDNEWVTWTYKQYKDECELGARALMAMGVPQFGTVGVYGFNAPEWFMAEISTMLCGAKVAGIYPSDSVENVVFKMKHSKASVLVLEDEGKLKRLQPGKDLDGKAFNPLDELPDLKYIVAWAASDKCPKELEGKYGKVPVISWKQFTNMGEKTKVEDLKERQSKIQPGHCCALIYTSGTTGRPKAVMISHDNIFFDAAITMSSIKNCGIGGGGQERVISYLPLSHVAGMMVDIISPMYLTAKTNGYTTVSFARPYDLKAGTMGHRLRAVKPTLFLGVPRVWEKVADKVKAAGKANTGFKKWVGEFMKPRMLANSKGMGLYNEPASPSGLTMAKYFSKKVQAQLGLSELKYAATAAAPIQTDTLEYYGSLGILVKEVYGMSECSGATTISRDDAHIWGSVGFATPGTEFKVLKEGKDGKFEEVPRAKDIFNATEEEQGELCYRGRHVMMGYLANPDFKEDGGTEWAKKKNESAIDANGWLHSGDKGCMDKHGMIKITGRYKELIIGAGGENVAPVPIENNVKKLEPAISNCMMFGDKKKFNIALVTLKVEGATGEEAGGNKLTSLSKIVDGVETVQDAMNNKEYIDKIMAAFVETNKNPKVCPKSAAKIGRFTILPTDFSTNGGELTATLKLKRSVVAKQYADAIENIYAAKLEKGQAYVNVFGKEKV